MLYNILVGALVLVGLCLAGTLALVYWPGAQQPARAAQEFDRPSAGSDTGRSFQELSFDVRDQTALYAVRYPMDSTHTIVLLHGVGADSSKFRRTASLLRDSVGAEVIALDLRGHGRSGGKPWDVDYIGQHEDDITDVLSRIRRERPNRKIILAGHSMGGGICLRFAQSDSSDLTDAYLLFAPNFGGTSPTTRTQPKDASEPQQSYAELRLKRLVGLIVLNAIGIHSLNDLPVLFLNQPPDYPAYSFRALMGSEPEQYTEALAAVDSPLLVVVGSDDEVFHSDQFEPIVSAHSDGETIVIEGANHDGIHVDGAAISAVAEWLVRKMPRS